MLARDFVDIIDELPNVEVEIWDRSAEAWCKHIAIVYLYPDNLIRIAPNDHVHEDEPKTKEGE